MDRNWVLGNTTDGIDLVYYYCKNHQCIVLTDIIILDPDRRRDWLRGVYRSRRNYGHVDIQLS